MRTCRKFRDKLFTETAPAKKMGNVVEIFFPDMNFESSLRPWFAFFKEENTDFIHDKVCSRAGINRHPVH
jgi:hypothetical protein